MNLILFFLLSLYAAYATDHFPNYFKELDYIVENPESSAYQQNLAQHSINKALQSILERIEIPYIDEKGNHTTKSFFKAISSIAKKKDPNAKLYIFGGVVRSLLGYIYKKIHNAHLKEVALKGRPLTNEESIQCTKRTFVVIINGISQKDYTEYLKDNSKELETIFKKDLSNFSVLGVGSDLDIVYTSSKPHEFLSEIKSFIDKARQNIKTTEKTEGFMNSFLPKSDILEYDEQLTRSVNEGGSSFDWFAFEIDNPKATLLVPEQYPDLAHDFVNGIYHYVNGTDKMPKQTVRGLRPLIEIPCVKLDEKSMGILQEELTQLSYIDQVQVDKLIRNARYGGANNRLIEGDDALSETARKTLKIPYFLKKTPIESRVVKNHDLDVFLTPLDTFFKDYTQDGVLLHGTPSLNNMLYMVRNGLYISQKDQGTDAFGPGVYTTHDVSTAKTYAKTNGIILEFPVKQNKNLRVLNYDKVKDKPQIKALQGTLSVEDFFKKLAKEYDIDIIINTHVIVQNADVLKTPKKAIDFIKSIYKDAELKLRQDTFIEADMQSIFNVLYAEEYEMLLTLLDPKQLPLIATLKDAFIRKLNDGIETNPNVSIFIFKNNILELKEKAIIEFKKILTLLFPGVELSPDDFMKMMSDDLPKVRLDNTNFIFLMTLKKDIRWIAFDLMLHMMQKDGTVPYENLRTLLDYDLYKNLFHLLNLGPLIIQCTLESEYPSAFLKQIIDFEKTGDSSPLSLVDLLQIENTDLRQTILDYCLDVFTPKIYNYQKDAWVSFLIEFSKRFPEKMSFLKDNLQALKPILEFSYKFDQNNIRIFLKLFDYIIKKDGTFDAELLEIIKPIFYYKNDEIQERACNVVLYLMQKDGQIQFNSLRALLDYENPYNKVFYSYHAVLGHLAIQRILENDSPSKLLEQMIKFQTIGDPHSDSLIKVLQIEDPAKRQMVLENCLSVFNDKIIALQKRDWMNLFLEYGNSISGVLKKAKEEWESKRIEYPPYQMEIIKNLMIDKKDFIN